MAEIQLQSIRKTYGKFVATDNVSLTIHDREFMVLLGPSGCGKTTLLRAIAGLEQIDGGRVIIGGQDVTSLPPRKRSIAMVFQSYAVFPHLTIFENIAFGLRMQKVAEDEIKRRVNMAADLLHIGDQLQKYAAQLSGGQRQRVAVARAIATQARVILMDEPLSNLDALLRLEMRAELKRLLNELNATVVYVTHDQIEALSLGDRIAVMKQGRILQCDSPLAVYDRPVDMFVGGFIGNPPMNFIRGETLVKLGMPVPSDGKIVAGIRSENIDALTAAEPGAITASAVVVEPLGSHTLITARVGDELIKVNAHPDMPVKPGQPLWLRPAAGKIRWMNAATQQAMPA